jgi:hypothetical protein
LEGFISSSDGRGNMIVGNNSLRLSKLTTHSSKTGEREKERERERERENEQASEHVLRIFWTESTSMHK